MKKKSLERNTSIGDLAVSVATYIIFALFAFVCAYPFYYIFINTISSNELSDKGAIMFLPKELHLKNYTDVFKMPGLLQAAEISLARTILGTVLTVVFAAFIGFMCTREHLWKRKLWWFSRFCWSTRYSSASS